MNDLVRRLSEGDHPVELRLIPEATPRVLRERLDGGYLQVKFVDTAGGTELTVPIDRERSDWAIADLERGTGRLRIVGALTLDDVPVRCIADVQLPALQGHGRLERLL